MSRSSTAVDCVAETPPRQARFVPGRTILPEHAREHTWYDVCAGRREGDAQPGMVLLDLGGRRRHVPETCLEFRPQPRAAERGPGRTVRGRALAAAASVLPLAAALVVAAHRFGWHRQG